MILTVLSFLFVITAVVVAHEFGHLLAAKRAGIGVDEFGIGMGPRLFGFNYQDTLYGLHLFPIGGYVNLAGEEGTPEPGTIDPDRDFNLKPLRQRVSTIVWGPLANIILAWIIIYLVIIFVGIPVGLTNQIAAIKPGSPADRAGLKVKDRIVSINHLSFTNMENAIETIHKWPQGQPLAITLERSGQKIDASIIPEYNEKTRISLVGFTPEVALRKHGPFSAVYISIKETGRSIIGVLYGFYLLFSGKVGLDGLAGPLGIAQITGQVAKNGLGTLLQFTAFISINLGLVNLLPIPALDGGRILFLGIELLRGRPFNPDKERIFHLVGFAFLIGLIVILTFSDLSRILVHKSFFK